MEHERRWNQAFYFQDPEAHGLEIISFPPRQGRSQWQTASGPLFLGIDHTAIVVSDTEKSLAFYRDNLGFKVAGTSALDPASPRRLFIRDPDGHALQLVESTGRIAGSP